MSDQTPEELAKAGLTRKTFKFADAIRDRSYPEEEVDVYLDEVTAYKLLDLYNKGTDISQRLNLLSNTDGALTEKLAALEAEREQIEEDRKALTAKIGESKYIFTVRGVEPGFYDDIKVKATEDYPVEYDEYVNDVTGARVKEEIPSLEREKLLENLTWQGHIVKITAPDGAVDIAPDLETIGGARKIIPTASRAHIVNAIEKVDMAVDWYATLADEVFLAKS